MHPAVTNTVTITMKEGDVQEETWEHADFSVTKHSLQRIPLLVCHSDDDDDDDDDNDQRDLSKQDRGISNSNNYIEILSVDTSSMSLLDVCNYVPDDQVDGSGHCVWMGALFFIHAVAILLLAEEPGSHSWKYLSSLFENKVCCEMGCGTGAAGIGLWKLMRLRRQAENNNCRTPTRVIFADNDKQALDLCCQNCQTNAIPEGSFEVVCQQPWSTDTAKEGDQNEDSPASSSTLQSTAIDTVFATDVLYDLTIIRPFLETASRLLDYHPSSSSTEGEERQEKVNTNTSTVDKHLVISHLPRWFLPRGNHPNRSTNDSASTMVADPVMELEHHILEHAQECGFCLIETIRPSHLLAIIRNATTLQTPESVVPELKAMAQAGAVLWVFRKKKRKETTNLDHPCDL